MTTAAALAACRRAYLDAFAQHAIYDAHGLITNPDQVSRLAASAYKCAMPDLVSWAAIRAYIACVSQGQVLDVLAEKEARTLMYTAQTALSTYARAQKTS